MTSNPGAPFCASCLRAPSHRSINWPDFAAASVAALRRERARHPEDHRLLDLIDELRRTDSDVANWWEDHGMRDYASVVKHIQHPTAGKLAFDIEIVYAPHEPDQRLVIYIAEPK